MNYAFTIYFHIYTLMYICENIMEMAVRLAKG